MGIVDRLLRWVGLDFDVDLTEERFHGITPRLVLGPRPVPADLDGLVESGVTHVVSCLAPTERPAMAFLDDCVQTTFVPLHDGIHEALSDALPAFFDAMAQVGDEGRLLVHCEVGVSRSATLAIVYVMETTGARFYEAFCEVRGRRPQILPNIGFATQLQRFEDARHAPRVPASLTTYLREVCKVPVEASVLQDALEKNDFDASMAIRSIFDGEIPRVVQGVRLR